MISKDKQLLEIQRGTEEILVEEEFAKRLHQKKPLKIKVFFTCIFFLFINLTSSTQENKKKIKKKYLNFIFYFIFQCTYS